MFGCVNKSIDVRGDTVANEVISMSLSDMSASSVVISKEERKLKAYEEREDMDSARGTEK